MEWRRPLIIGRKATARMSVRSAVKKGVGDAVPMVFVNQGIEISNVDDREYAILEERTHVYFTLGIKLRKFRQGMSAGSSVYTLSLNVIRSARSASA